MIEPALKNRLLNSWKSIKQITGNPANPGYQINQRRGWNIQNQFISFSQFCEYVIENLGPPPRPGSKLCRKDHKKDFAPGNIVWADSTFIGTRYTRTIWVRHQGQRVRLTSRAETLGLNCKTVLSRYWAGDRGQHLFRPTRT